MFGFGKKEGGHFKIIYNRKKCIGARTCAVMAPKQWVMNDDRKADLIGGTQENGLWTKMVGEKEMHEHIKAANGCPKGVIEIIDTRTGEKIAPR